MTQKIERLISGEAESSSMTPLEGWLLWRRFEWAAQLCQEKGLAGIEPDADLPDVLRWLLIRSWDSDGCIGFWMHAERGGKPPPENHDRQS